MSTHGSEQGTSVFETSDLNLASFLRCRGFDIGGIQRAEDGRTSFQFEDTGALRRAILDFANDGPIGVRSFSSTIRDLKGMVRPAAGERRPWGGGRR